MNKDEQIITFTNGSKIDTPSITNLTVIRGSCAKNFKSGYYLLKEEYISKYKEILSPISDSLGFTEDELMSEIMNMSKSSVEDAEIITRDLLNKISKL